MFLEHNDDAIGSAPEVHQNIFENEQIRVLNVVVPPKHKTALHWHPKNMGYVIVPGILRFFFADGTAKDVTLSKNQITQGEGIHAVENPGDEEVRVIQIEFKR
jgi:hypothetical protein